MTNHKHSSIFNRDFYPTPKTVLDLMQIDCREMIVLEPSAGKGDIIDYLKHHGAANVFYCEINNELAEICKSKARFLNHDFLKVTAEQISHIGQIVMNPPFSEATKHILHAWEIAPDGCEIIALCNTETVSNWKYERREELYHVIQDYGSTFDLGDCFNEAERKTDVEVTCIKIYKPVSTDNVNFEGFYLDAEPEVTGSEGVMKYNEVQALVNSYIGALKCFDEFTAINDKMKTLCEPVGMDKGFAYEISYNKQTANKLEFSKELQRASWKHIFGRMNLNKYLTSGVMEDINKFVETQTQIPFTVKNIYKMFDIIVGTKDQSLSRALVEAIDAFTKHTHENRYGVEGWKTNSGYMLNKKIIIDWVFEKGWASQGGRLRIRSSNNVQKLDDLTKVICNLIGFDYNDTRSLSELVHQFNGIETNKWYSNGFFEVKGFMKGTVHLKFADLKVWELLNRRYAEIKGEVLPEKI